MGAYFLDDHLTGEGKRWRLDLLSTSPDLYSDIKLEDRRKIIHFLQADHEFYTSEGKKWKALRFHILSIDPREKKYWGPYHCGRWNTFLDDFDVVNAVHRWGYCKFVLGEENQDKEVCNNTDFTNFYHRFNFNDWQIVWEIINQIRLERINKRSQSPRETSGQKFKEDIIDAFVARLVSRINAIFNQELFWGKPFDYDLPFDPRNGPSFEEKMQKE
jgi:hypothetical protein